MQKAAFKKSLKQVTEPPRDVGIINDVSPTILGFKLTSSMNESAVTVRTAARLYNLSAYTMPSPSYSRRGGRPPMLCCAGQCTSTMKRQ